MKNLFVVYSHFDEEAVDSFKAMLQKTLKKENLDQFIHIHEMRDHPANGKESILSTNADDINKGDIFLLMMSNQFVTSDYIMKVELTPIVKKVINSNNDALMWKIPLKKVDIDFKEKVIIEGSNTFKSQNARIIDNFWDDIPEHQDSQRLIFVSDFVEQLTPYITNDFGDEIRYVNQIPHIEEFLKNKPRDLKVISKDFTLLGAKAMLTSLPPIRHLLVVDENQALFGLISIKDVLRYNFKNKFKKKGRFVTLSQESQKATVGEYCIPNEKIRFSVLSDSPPIDSLIRLLLGEHDEKKEPSVGMIPVLKEQNSFSNNDYELVSYIDILKLYERLPVSRELKKIKASDFPEQNQMIAVFDSDSIDTVRELLSQGIRTVPVIDDNEKLIGLIPTNTVLDVSDENITNNVRTIMNKVNASMKNIVLTENMKFNTIVQRFLLHREYTSLPVLNDNGNVQKFIGYSDILRMMAEKMEAYWEDENNRR